MRAIIRDNEMFYTSHGRGVPILLMHGGPGLDHSYFRPWLDGLGDVAELIYFDMRGNGRSASAGAESLKEITIDTWVDDAEALRLHLQHETLIILGHGYGGFIAQHYALRYPKQTRGLILCDAVPAFDYPQAMIENATAQCTPQQMAQVIAMLSRPVADDLALRQIWRETVSSYFYRHDPKIAAAMIENVAYSAAAYNHGSFTLAPSVNTLPFLQQIAVPALLLAGKHDWLMPPAQGLERFSKQIAGAKSIIFDESGHFPFIEEPIAFCNAVRCWLRKTLAING